MLQAQIHYTVDSRYLADLKAGAAKHFPQVPPALRTEVLARGLGFRTWASMQASHPTRAMMNIESALAFAHDRGITIAPLDLHLAMAQATLLRVARLTPNIHWDGIKLDYFTLSKEELKAIHTAFPDDQIRVEVLRQRMAKFEASRKKLISGNYAGQVLRAICLVSLLIPTKSVWAGARSSYKLKHIAENLTFHIGGGLVLKPEYIASVDVIIAAIDAGFPVKPYEGQSPNAAVGATVASVEALEAMRQDRESRS